MLFRLFNKAIWSTCFSSALVLAVANAAAQDSLSGIYTIPATGGAPTFLTTGGVSKTGSPAWSPDGKHIAYDLFGPGGFKAGTVEVINSDGTEKRSLGLGAMPTWSPDGSQLVFHTYAPGAISVVNLDGTERKKIINHWGNPVWMNDKDKILSIKQGGIAIFDFATNKEDLILETQWKIKYGISLSPDNQKLAFRNRLNQLNIANLANRPVIRADVNVRVSQGKTLFSSWSPDSKRLAINWKAPGEEFSQIYILDADGSGKPEWLEGQDRTTNNEAPAWSPDGKTIAYCDSKR